ncbi:MAG TPA: hypothetical protein VG649_09165, partial [Candidatus Angelobacter sp.]|nr:hypothetical protein [Candidatus Angelobacter sp.]
LLLKPFIHRCMIWIDRVRGGVRSATLFFESSDRSTDLCQPQPSLPGWLRKPETPRDTILLSFSTNQPGRAE